MDKPATNVGVEELRASKELQAAVFKRMLGELEQKGRCSYDYHRLAIALFDDSMSAEDER